MEGLEISEVGLRETLSNNRIDAECYKKTHILISKEIIAYPHKTLSNIAEVTDGEHGSPKLDEKSGIVYLSGHNIRNNFIDYSEIRYCDKSIHEKNARSALKVNNVLLSIVGTVGNASVIYENIEGNTDRNVATIKNIQGVNPYYLSTFLNSKYGRYQTEKLSTGNVQPLLNLIQVKSIIVCLPSDIFQKEIEQLVRASHNKAKQALVLYNDAENVLLEELNLKKWQPEKKSYNIKQLKESFLASGRLDAEYYQSKYDTIEEFIKRYKYGWNSIRAFFSLNNEVCCFTKQAYNYIEIGDIDTANGSANYTNIETQKLPYNARNVLHKGDILISKVRPYRGAVSIIDFDREDLICSGAFTVLREKKDYKKEVLQVLLRTPIYKEWILKWNVGSSYPVIKDENVLNLPVPIIPKKIQDEIATYVQKSVSLRQQAKQLLEDAKLMVEKEIQ